MKFKSWVPTVTGQLSFTVIGRTDWPTRCVSLSRLSAKSAQGAIFVQERYTHDFALPFVGLPASWLDWIFWNVHILGLEPISGRHSYFCIVDKPSSEADVGLTVLTGKIFPVVCDKHAKRSVDRARTRVLDAKHVDSIETISSEVSKDIYGLFPVEASFSLHRNGEFSLVVEKSESAINFENLNDTDIERYAAQCFYFVRDISHNHQHHHGSNDLIVRLHRDDETWNKNVYYDLFRSVIQFKRLKTDFHITNASGVLAYSESFRLTFLKNESQTYFKDNTILSLETAKYELSLKQSRKANFIAVFQTLLFGFLGVSIALTQVAGLDGIPKVSLEPSWILTKMTSLVVEHTVPTAAVAFVMSAVGAKFLGMSLPEEKVYIRNTLKVFSKFKRGWKATLLISVSALLAWLALYVALAN